MSELLLGAGANHARRLTCGRGHEWTALTTLDMHAGHKPDVVWDLNDLPLPFETDSVDEVHAYHTLEHFGAQGDWRAFLGFFAEVWRILKPDGCFAGITPTADSPWAWADPGHTRLITLDTLVFLSQPSYAIQVGVTAMADYRGFYAADFDIVFTQQEAGENLFILRAVKPSRIGQPHRLQESKEP